VPAPFTIVVLKDEDGDEFPIRLPGVYENNQAADHAAALQIIREESRMRPRGELTLARIEYSTSGIR
jgi:hypothetical protein